MTDCTDLIAQLRAHRCSLRETNVPVAEEAANAMEALMAERDKLRQAIQQAEDALLWCTADGRMASPLLQRSAAIWAAEVRAAKHKAT